MNNYKPVKAYMCEVQDTYDTEWYNDINVRLKWETKKKSLSVWKCEKRAVGVANVSMARHRVHT